MIVSKVISELDWPYNFPIIEWKHRLSSEGAKDRQQIVNCHLTTSSASTFRQSQETSASSANSWASWLPWLQVCLFRCFRYRDARQVEGQCGGPAGQLQEQLREEQPGSPEHAAQPVQKEGVRAARTHNDAIPAATCVTHPPELFAAW